MTSTRLVSGLFALALACSAPMALAQDEVASFAETIETLDHRDGFFPLYVDETDGRILAALTPQADGSLGRMVYAARLTSGLGSNPVGLDRGAGGGSEILRFSRVNGRVFAEFENTLYRAIGAGDDERRATAQSFARSIIWSTDILAEHDGRVLIDLSGFLGRDAVGTAQQLSDTGQGSFSVDADRSAPLTSAAFVFPENVEIDALLTLKSTEPGSEVRAVTPSPDSVTLTVHHSFIQLPDDGYTIREADDRSGAITTTVYDMAAPLDAPIRRSFAVRHRLERVDPTAASGPVVEPIVYYVDRGAPDAIRDALIEGASWWGDAFEAAGFEDAYRVELLPEGVHPLDARYNVIQWVHRQTRGWSYGGAVRDPRTGEIIRGYVILGSQRVRQDRMIFEGLLGVDATAGGGDEDPLELALDRIRQLSAHEVGHTIGMSHNFAASVSDRASVMDYPAPLVSVDSAGAIDVSRAYDVGIGAWDRVAISWLYAQYADPEIEADAQNAILDQARQQGLRFITDRHARGTNSGHPLANLWDNGADPTAELIATLDVRAVALRDFGTRTLAGGLPTSELRGVFPPLYLYHRYQAEAAAKALGGVLFDYEVNSGRVEGLMPYPAADQRRALAALIMTLDAQALDIPDSTLNLLTPSPYSDYDAAATRELFDSAQYPAFSRRDAAAAAARISLRAMLSSARLARIADQSARDAGQLSQAELFDALESALFQTPGDEAARLVPIREAVQGEYVDRLLDLAGDTTPASAGIARYRLEALSRSMSGRRGPGRREFRTWLSRRIDAGLAAIDDGEDVQSSGTEIPPGSPIGSAAADSCWHCDSAGLLGLH
jgi:hypothetical protein